MRVWKLYAQWSVVAAWKAGGEVHMEGMEHVASHSHTKG